VPKQTLSYMQEMQLYARKHQHLNILH